MLLVEKMYMLKASKFGNISQVKKNIFPKIVINDTASQSLAFQSHAQQA